MGLFENSAEKQRKEKLKILEDKRLRFVHKLLQGNLLPGQMLFAQTENGGFVAVGALEKGALLITAPGPGEEADFEAIPMEFPIPLRLDRVEVSGEGMGGVLGLGKKGYAGYTFVFFPDAQRQVLLPVLAGFNCVLEADSPAKNPFFREKRRRGDANFVWDFLPLEKKQPDILARKWMEILRKN